VAQQTLDFVIAQQVTGQADVARLIKSVGALDAEMQKLRSATQGMGAGFQQAAGAIRGSTNVLDAQSKALRNQRQGMQQAGMQVNDFVTSISTGASPVQAFNQQIGQLGYALSMMEGRAGAVGRFLAGPWSIAVIGAAMVLGPMIENLLGVGKASDGTGKSIDDLVEKKRQSTVEARRAEIAEDAFGRTLEGVRVAIEANRKAMEALNRVKRTSAQDSLNQAKKTMANALVTQFDTHQQLMNAQALLQAQMARASGPGQGAELAALGLQARVERVQELTAAFARGSEELVRAQNAINEAQSFVTVERGMATVEDRINRRFDAEIDGTRKAALARGQVGASLQREIEQIEAARQAELDRVRDSEGASRRATAAASALERKRNRELEQAQAIAEKIRDMGLTYGAVNKQVGETAKKLDDFNDMVAKLQTLNGGAAVAAELAGTIDMVRQAIVDEGAEKALKTFNDEVDKLIKKDLTPFEQSIAGLNQALANEELLLDPESGTRYYEALSAAARPFFDDAIKGQQDLIDKAMGVDNAFQMQVTSLQSIIATMQAAGAPTEALQAQLAQFISMQDELKLAEKNAEIKNSFEAVGQAAANAFKGMITGAQSFGDAMKGVIQAVIDELFRLFVVQQIVGFFTKSLGGVFNIAGTTPAPTNLLPPGYAIGGYPAPGKPAIVGERGPELFVPTGSGKIIPNHQLGGGNGMVINVDARGSTDPEAVRQQVERGILEAAPSIVAAAEQRTISTLRRPRLAGVL
jgi:hypothetical protein